VAANGYTVGFKLRHFSALYASDCSGSWSLILS
jgi:hypothetical protein